MFYGLPGFLNNLNVLDRSVTVEKSSATFFRYACRMLVMGPPAPFCIFLPTECTLLVLFLLLLFPTGQQPQGETVLSGVRGSYNGCRESIWNSYLALARYSAPYLAHVYGRHRNSCEGLRHTSQHGG